MLALDLTAKSVERARMVSVSARRTRRAYSVRNQRPRVVLHDRRLYRIVVRVVQADPVEASLR